MIDKVLRSAIVLLVLFAESSRGFVSNNNVIIDQRQYQQNNQHYWNTPVSTPNRAKHAQLNGIPSSVLWILGHEVIGSAPVPFIAQATKKGGWLSKIDRPSWNPPDWLFGPVWTTLYCCMGLSVSRICSSTKPRSVKNPLLVFWGIHFVLNVSWAPVFFCFKRFRAALIISCLMVITLMGIIPLFYRVNVGSALLLIPYLAWISFATVLNAAICKRNPTDKYGYNNGMLQAQIQALQEDAAKYAGL
jgi:tryptophan-rich sensory protein